MLTTVYITLAMLTSIPLGILFSKINIKEERSIIKFYFPAILWGLAVASAIFLTLNLLYALTTIYLFIMVFVWWKLNQ